MTPNRKRKQFLLFLADLLILCASLVISLLLRYFELPSVENYLRHIIEFIPLMLFWLIMQYISGLYSLEGAYKRFKSGINLFFVAVCSLFVGFAWFYLFPFTSIGPRTVLIIYCAVSFAVLLIWRNILTIVFSKISQTPKIGVIGISDALDELVQHSKGLSYMSYSIVGIFDEKTDKTVYQNIPVYKTIESFLQIVQTENISQIVVIEKKGLSSKIQTNLFSLLKNRINFVSIADFYETYTRKIPLTEINELWFLENIDLNNKRIYAPIKRFFDILLSGLLLLITLPFYPLFALIIKLESKGPVFFKQVRSGYLAQDFTVLKFRSMSVSNNNFAPTGQNDARITKFGNIMRKTRIDELPQFINVLKGEMSLIGPRPERPELIEELEKQVPYYRQRLLIRPGISGWDQVSGEYHSPSVEDTTKKLQYDLYYVKNMSPALDVSILAKTLKTVVSRGGL